MSWPVYGSSAMEGSGGGAVLAAVLWARGGAILKAESSRTWLGVGVRVRVRVGVGVRVRVRVRFGERARLG